MTAKKIILAGGGTGGHIYPAIAIASGIKQIYPDADILFVGTSKGLERELVGKVGFPLKTIRVAGFKRKLSLDTLLSMKELALGSVDSIRLISKVKPDLVIGTGGYVSGPVLLFASLLGVPTIIHEQNVKPGVTNRILSRFVDKIAVSFSDSMQYFPKDKTVLTGNPIRKEIVQGNRREALKSFGLSSDIPVVLCFGGSQGAARLNKAIIHVIQQIHETKKFQLIHITGKNHYEKTRNILANKGIDPDKSGHIILRPYIYEMGKAYMASDLIISRAGALSISEINLCGKPAILIPLPTAANKHQDYNAQSLKKNGAGIIISDRDLTGQSLLATIENIIFDKKKLLDMSKASKALSKPDALEKITREVRLLVG